MKKLAQCPKCDATSPEPQFTCPSCGVVYEKLVAPSTAAIDARKRLEGSPQAKNMGILGRIFSALGKVSLAIFVVLIALAIMAKFELSKESPSKQSQQQAKERAKAAAAATENARQEAAKAGRVTLAMNKEHIKVAWGEPDRITRSESALGQHEVWYYLKGRSSRTVTFSNGLVSNFTESDN